MFMWFGAGVLIISYCKYTLYRQTHISGGVELVENNLFIVEGIRQIPSIIDLQLRSAPCSQAIRRDIIFVCLC